MVRISNLNLTKTLPFNSDIMHLYVKNKLKQLYIRATAPHMPTDDGLPVFQIAISPNNLTELNSDLPNSGKNQYYNAYVKYQNNSYNVKLRYVGDNNWHWLYPKKSYKIKTRKSKLIAGARRINIKIPRWLWLLNEPVANELAQQMGLIAPRVFPIKVVLNNIYMGLYYFQDPIDESVLRRHHLMPGSVYSGDFAGKNQVTGVSRLWQNSTYWEKDASRNASTQDFRGDIRRFIQAVNKLDLEQFFQFCSLRFDNESYMKYLSLDNIIGCQHHDYAHNHKFYFDPYRGKFIPIYWDVGEISLRSPKLDMIGNPFLNKWKLIPEFDLQRKKVLYQAITNGPLNSSNIIQLIDKYHKLVRPALEADVYRLYVNRKRTSVLNFPPSSPSEPFFINKYQQMVKDFQRDIEFRQNSIKQYLSKSNLFFKVEKRKNTAILRIQAPGNVGAIIETIKVLCQGEKVRIYRDINQNHKIDKHDIQLASATVRRGKAVFPLAEKILPGYRKVDRPDRGVLLAGKYDLIPSPLEYSYLIKTDNNSLENIMIEAKNIITGEKIIPEKKLISSDLTDLTISLHPWKIPPVPASRQVTLGPGKIYLQKTVKYEKHIQLTILAGTQIFLDKGVSIFCSGKVIARGRKNKPIVFTASDKSLPWGGFVVQGKETSNSLFEYCRWEYGSLPKSILVDYSGMVSIRDSDNVVMRHCLFANNRVGDDSLHYAYASGKVEHCLFLNARADAFDVDISDVDVKYCYFNNCGNDALDFMTSTSLVENCLLIKAADKGISVGEDSRITIANNIIENCHIGVEIKDKSLVNYKTNLIKGSDIAVNLFKKNWRYDGGGMLNAKVIYQIDCHKKLVSDKYSTLINQDVKIRNQAPALDFQRRILSNINIKQLVK